MILRNIRVAGTTRDILFWEAYEGFCYPCDRFTAAQAWEKFSHDWQKHIDFPDAELPDACGVPRHEDTIRMRALIRSEFPEYPTGQHARDI